MRSGGRPDKHACNLQSVPARHRGPPLGAPPPRRSSAGLSLTPPAAAKWTIVTQVRAVPAACHAFRGGGAQGVSSERPPARPPCLQALALRHSSAGTGLTSLSTSPGYVKMHFLAGSRPSSRKRFRRQGDPLVTCFRFRHWPREFGMQRKM